MIRFASRYEERYERYAEEQAYFVALSKTGIPIVS